MTDNDRREVNRTMTAVTAAVILSMGAAGCVGYRIAHDETPRSEAGGTALTVQPTPPPPTTPSATDSPRPATPPPGSTSARNTRPPATTRTTSTTPTAAK